MRIKRVLLSALACIMAVNLLSVSASAHGGHGSGGCHGRRTGTRQTVISVCTVDGCSVAGRHVHNGVVYCGYGHESGYCTGTCLALCPVEGCTTVGPHVHNNVTYCGNGHDCGFCDGACSAYPHGGWHH